MSERIRKYEWNGIAFRLGSKVAITDWLNGEVFTGKVTYINEIGIEIYTKEFDKMKEKVFTYSEIGAGAFKVLRY